MCRLPLAHYTKQWNCLFLLCLLGFFTQSSPSHDAVLWFHFVGRLSYPIPKKNTSGNDGSEDGTMLCNASTGDGGGAAYVEWTSWVFFPMDSNGDSEFAWGLQPWSGMGTVPGEALWDFWCVKENKWESQTLTKNRDHHLLDVESFNRHC